MYICVSKQKDMIIPDKLMEKWKVLRSPLDTAMMAKEMKNGYAELFNRAFREGKCNDDVFNIMANFYEKKAALIQEYL